MLFQALVHLCLFFKRHFFIVLVISELQCIFRCATAFLRYLKSSAVTAFCFVPMRRPRMTGMQLAQKIAATLSAHVPELSGELLDFAGVVEVRQ